MPVAHQVFLTNAGAPLVSGKVCLYAAGTTTPQSAYSDEALTVALPNPIRTNTAGRMVNGSGTETNVYWSQSSYKVVVLTAGTDATCSTGTTIYSGDHIPAIPSSAAATDVDGVAGETITAGQAVYLKSTDGKWYKADSATTTSSSTAGMVGIAPSNIASGATGSIRLQGRITGLSALAAGAKYYISTAGTITITPPTNARYLAQADSTTSIVVGGNPGSIVLPGANGVASIVLRTSSTPTVDRTLTIVPGDAARTLTMTGDATVNQDVSTTGMPTFGATAITGPITISGAAAGQVIFPATENPSANANTLDDYEEGVVTYTDGSGAALSITNNGSQYVKTGQLVTISLDVTYPATANGSNAVLAGLPYANQATNSWGGTCFGGLANLDVRVSSGAATVNFVIDDGTAQSNATLSTLTIRCAFVYRAAN